jgi:ATP-dependent helicase/nuclease subunit B
MREDKPSKSTARSRSPAASGAGAVRCLIVSGRASERLAAARRWISDLPRGDEAWVLSAHGYAADELARADAADSGSRFGLHRFTVDRLAARLAAPALARRGAAPATSLSLTAVAARAIHRVLEEGSAGRFEEIARRPGFPHAATRTIEELRSAGVTASDLRAREPWGADLAAILELTEEELSSLALADRAEVLELAREAVESGAAGSAVPLLLLDLPLEERIDTDLVAALVARAPRVLATAPMGDARAIARLEGMLGVSASSSVVEEGLTSLDLLQRHLFEETGPEPRAIDGTVSLSSWPGEARECVEIARRMQEEAARGMPFDRMAVFLRSPGAYRSHLEEALRRAAIPAYYARGTRRPDPAGRALLALLACAAEGFSARRFSEYLSLAQVPDPDGAAEEAWSPPDHDLMPSIPPESRAESPEEPSAEPVAGALDPDAAILEGSLRAPWRWERLLVDAAVIGGRDRWKRRLDGLVAEIAVRRSELAEEDARAAGLQRMAEDLEHLRAFALPLIDRLASFPAEAKWSVWIEHLRGLTGAAVRQPAGVLRVLTELEPLGPVPVDLTMVQHVLSPRLRDLTHAPEQRPGGSVFVAPIELARGMGFDLVFVPGLAERLFPPRIIEDPLLPDEARRSLDGGTLATQENRVQAQRLALRLAVGAAARAVSLSWPRVDLESARSRVPSFYGLEAARAAEGRLPGFDELRDRAELGGRGRLGWPAPERPDLAIDDTEYDLAVLGNLRDADPETSAGAARYLLAANPHLERAIRARGLRWLVGRWTPSDGLVDPDEDALAALARHRMGARPFSPTALENFSACPYRFLLQAIHRIQPREEAEALETIDPLTRGALFHEIQFVTLTELRDGGQLPLDAGRLEAAFALLDRSVDRVAAAWEEKLAPAIGRVWTDGVNAIRADLREWLRRATEEARGWVPYRFELSFGLADRDRPTADSASVPEAVWVLENVLLRGSVDLVERQKDGTLRVTDHKTGKARVPEESIIWGGKALQPILYALAVEALLKQRVASGRLYYCTAAGEFSERDIPLDDMSREAAKNAIGVVARALEQGFLPAAPGRDECRWCDYRPICGPHEAARTARKKQDRLVDLESLRSIP